jgi:hypothetical protein
MTHQTHRMGQLLAEEINTGRRIRAVMDEIAKRKDFSALVISRRAKKFLDECSSERAQVVIDGAARKAGLRLTTSEFSELVEAACERNQAACRRLVWMAQQLAPHLPEKRGRPISIETCTHMVFQELVAGGGICPSYTFSEVNGDDFVDPVTQATRLAVNNPRFSPLGAKRLRKTLDDGSNSGISVRRSGPRRKAVSGR